MLCCDVLCCGVLCCGVLCVKCLSAEQWFAITVLSVTIISALSAAVCVRGWVGNNTALLFWGRMHWDAGGSIGM